ncbi:MAG TPA: hypothetical protein VFJ21_13290, partial [Mycobacteriales bacterium]|nr:hypothetical protein [Mycobacteriales bacterium]
TTLIHVDHVVRVDDLGEHVHCNLFVGRPEFNLTRSGDVVQVTAADKAVLGMGQAWRPLHIPKHTPKVEAIRRILSERMGEVRFDFPHGMDKPVLHRSINIGRMGRPWAYADRIAESMDYQLFYRGNVATLRPWPRRPVYTFDPSQEIVAAVETDIRMRGFKDLVEIRGHRVHGSRRRIRAVARPNKSEPFSPEELAFHDVPGFHVRRETHPHIRSVQEAQRKAERILEDRQDAVAGEATLNIVPLAFLEEGDKYRAVTTDGDLATFRLRSFAFPIGVSGDGGEAPAMSLNYHERPPLHPPHHKLRRHHRGA